MTGWRAGSRGRQEERPGGLTPRESQSREEGKGALASSEVRPPAEGQEPGGRARGAGWRTTSSFSEPWACAPPAVSPEMLGSEVLRRVFSEAGRTASWVAKDLWEGEWGSQEVVHPLRGCRAPGATGKGSTVHLPALG